LKTLIAQRILVARNTVVGC